MTHGGIGRVTSEMLLPDIAQIDRFREPFEELRGGSGSGRGGGGGGGASSASSVALSELLWADPLPDLPGGGPEFDVNAPRGLPLGFSWGAAATRRFLARNGLQALVRSHQCCSRGVRVAHDNACVTVFSAPNYVDQVGANPNPSPNPNPNPNHKPNPNPNPNHHFVYPPPLSQVGNLGGVLCVTRPKAQGAGAEAGELERLDINVVQFASVPHPLSNS